MIKTVVLDWGTFETSGGSYDVGYHVIYQPEIFDIEECICIAEQFHAEQMGW